MSTPKNTPRGTRQTAITALRHGLTGRVVVLPAADLDPYKAHVKSITAKLNPDGAEEIQLAALIADGYWRLQRLQSIEEGILAIQFAQGETLANDLHVDATLNQSQAFLNHAREIEHLTLYEARLHRNIKAAAARLEKLQAARCAARAEALENAKLLARLTHHERAFGAKGLSAAGASPDLSPQYPPQTGAAGHGFEFSLAEIDRAIHFEDRLRQARNLPKPLARAA